MKGMLLFPTMESTMTIICFFILQPYNPQMKGYLQLLRNIVDSAVTLVKGSEPVPRNQEINYYNVILYQIVAYIII